MCIRDSSRTRTILDCPAYSQMGGLYFGARGINFCAYSYNAFGTGLATVITTGLGLGGKYRDQKEIRAMPSGTLRIVPTREAEIVAPSEMLTITDAVLSG